MWGWIAAAYMLIGFGFAVSLREARGMISPYSNSRADTSRQLARQRLHELGYFGQPEPDIPKWKLMLFVLIVGLIWIAVWPVMVSTILWGGKKLNDEIPYGLTFSWMGGHGELICRDCQARMEVTGFLHWLGKDAKDTETGFQCQLCFKFAVIDNSDWYGTTYHCECGGVLSREDTIHCPACRSVKVDYEMEYIT